jgi:1-acyl-sn-glycerol-3-phosphate acyltransferase
VALRITNLLKVYGKDNAKEVKGLPCVVIANHKNAFDPWYVSSHLNDVIYWISKYENQFGIFGYVCKRFNPIFLNKERKWTVEGKKKALRALENGKKIGVFPEGTRIKNEMLGYFHKGSANLCLQAQVPYLPVAIIGSAVPFKGRTKIVYGKPCYDPVGLKNNYGNAVEITEKMKETIEDLIKKHS